MNQLLLAIILCCYASLAFAGTDGDGVPDASDNCPNVANADQLDTDSDGAGNECDADDDGDGTADQFDQFPLNVSEIRDTDSDGTGDNADTDDDNDGLLDSEDLFPQTVYETTFLTSNLSASPFGIINYGLSAVDDPSIQLGYTYDSWELGSSGSYFQSGRELNLGTWSKVGEGYVLRETVDSQASYPLFDTSGDYVNIDWSGLGISPGESPDQFEVVYRTTHKLGVIEKGAKTWRLAYQTVTHTYTTDSAYAIDTSLPIKVVTSSITTIDIVAPTKDIVVFTSSELLGTWMIGGINEDDLTLAPQCNSNAMTCADLVTLNADGTGSTVRSERSMTWTLLDDGSVRLTFTDNGSVFTVRRIEKDLETSSVQVSSVANGKYFSRMQLMIKNQESTPQLSDLLLGKMLANGFSITDSRKLRSSVDNKLIEIFGFNLTSDGGGSQIQVSSDGSISTQAVTWSYSDGDLVMERFAYDIYRLLRIWKLVLVTDTRMYVMETLDYQLDGDGDGVFEEQWALVSRPNFYEWVPFYDIDDIDRDGVPNDNDLFPVDPIDWADADGDGIGDNTDPDDDNDGVIDSSDGYPLIALNGLPDADDDGVPNDCDSACISAGMGADTDDDNDGVPDVADAFPLLSIGTATDTDADGAPDTCDASCIAIGMSADTDDDGDGTADSSDAFPLDATESIDTDADGVGNNADADDDNDGVSDELDAFPLHSTYSTALPLAPGDVPEQLILFQPIALSDPDFSEDESQGLHLFNTSGTFLRHNEWYESTEAGAWSVSDDQVKLRDVERTAGAYYVGSYEREIFGWNNIDVTAWEDHFQSDASQQVEVKDVIDEDWSMASRVGGMWVFYVTETVKLYLTDSSYTSFLIDETLPVKTTTSKKLKTFIDSSQALAFTETELIGSWAFRMDLDTTRTGLTAFYMQADVAEFLADGTGVTKTFARAFTWTLSDSGVVTVTFDDNGATIVLTKYREFADSIAVHSLGEHASKTASSFRFGFKQSATAIDLANFYGKDLVISSGDPFRSELGTQADGTRQANYWGYVFNADNTMTNYVSFEQGYLNNGNQPWGDDGWYTRAYTWSLSDGLLSASGCALYDLDGDGLWDDCYYKAVRNFRLVRASSNRIYYVIHWYRHFDGDVDKPISEMDYVSNYHGFLEVFDASDLDGDGISNKTDAFVFDSTETIDTDADGTGNNADTDDDADGVLDTADAFPLLSIGAATDTDADGAPDTCDASCIAIGMSADTDDDGDGTPDASDAFPLDATETVDTDNDGVGNSADTDDDNDGVLDTADAFALISLGGLTDTDGDGRPNDCDSTCQTAGMSADTDDDNDGVLDTADALPLDSAESVDTDADGTGNNADTDDDNDEVLDADDAFPLDATESIDTDADGVGNNADTDDDNDGVSDGADLFPLDASESSDADSDGIGNNADEDDDNDLVLDSDDAFPEDVRYAADLDGDRLPDEWEEQYGLDIDDPKNAYFDPDQDGYLNWEEFLSGSDPVVAERKAQVIYTDRVAILTPGRTSSFTVSYTTTDLNPNLTGVGIRIHYNSAYVTEVVLENIFDPGLLGVDQVQNDEFDLDGDADTDRYFIVAWADTNDPTWPGQLPTDLFDIVITTTETIVDLDFYPIRFSVAGAAVGYNLSVPSVYNPVVSASLDIDGDGEANALSDGLMVIRRFFGFTGESLISGAVSDDATYKTAETIAERIDAFSDGFDVDADGQVEALSDGLMIIRRLFGFSGESLVAGALSASAERTDPDEIAAYIDSLANIQD